MVEKTTTKLSLMLAMFHVVRMADAMAIFLFSQLVGKSCYYLYKERKSYYIFKTAEEKMVSAVA